MKKILTIIILINLCSCNSYKPIIQYMNNKTNEINNNQIIIIKEKLTTIKAINILRGLGYFDIKDSIYKYNGSKIYNKKDYDYLYKKYKRDTIKENWQSKNFSKKKLLVDDMLIYMKENKKLSQNIFFYSISNPIYTNNNQQVFFLINKYVYFLNIKYSKVVVMKKNKNNWYIIKEIDNYELN